jgi:hypothetical protein
MQREAVKQRQAFGSERSLFFADGVSIWIRPEMSKNKHHHVRSTLCAWSFIVLAAGQMAMIGAARADADTDTQASQPAWSFGGFGTVGMVHADTRQADYSSTVLKASGAGYSRPWSFDVDSRLGAQLDVKLDARWSAVLQVISEQNVDNSYAPIVEWANIKYQATPDLSVRIGRIALPLLLAADSRKASYAFPSVRTPVELYGAVPISNSDGIDVNYRWNVGPVKNMTQAMVGNTRFKVTNGPPAEGRAMVGLSNTSSYGALTLCASVLTLDLTFDAARALFDGFRQFGPQGIALAEKYDADRKRVNVVGIGASYDPGNWFATAELARVRIKSFLGDRTGLYVSTGYRFGNLTPYATYARARDNSDRSDPGLSLTGLAPATAGAATMLNAGLSQLLGTVATQQSWIAGVRWDVARNMALKLQYDRVLPQGGSAGTLLNVQPGFRSGVAVNVVSAALDFVY